MADNFDLILRDSLELVVKSKGFKDFNTAPQNQRGKALTEFYINEIGRYLYPIFEDDIEQGLIDGKSDLGIDFIYNRDNDWFIFQSKYKGNSTSLSLDEIAGFFQIYSRINDHEFVQNHASATLKDQLVDLNEDSNIQFVFITNDKIYKSIEDEFERLKNEHEGLRENVSFELKGISELKRDYKSVLSDSEAIAEEVIIHIEVNLDSFSEKNRASYFDLSEVIDKQGKYKSILCTIKGNALKNLWLQHKSRLFNYNIRGFLGENAINKKMRETLENEPDKFYFYNNGISAICTDLVPVLSDHNTVKAFKCKNFSIINGAQTTSTIGRYKNVNKLNDVRILLKITKAEDYKKEKGLNKKIITFNNSQTIIKASDFRSNDEIQIFLENKLADFSYRASIPHKRVRYQRKRLKVPKSKEHLDITIEALARALYVFDHDPVSIFKGTRYLFDDDTENNGKYWLIFGENGKEIELFDNKRLEKTIAIYFLWFKVEELIKSTSKSIKADNNETIKYQALLAKWHFLWSYGYVIKTFYFKEQESIFKKLSNGKYLEHSSTTFIEKWFPKIHNTIAKCIERKYNDTKKGSEETQSFNFKNWLRNDSAFKELVTEFKYKEKDDFPLAS